MRSRRHRHHAHEFREYEHARLIAEKAAVLIENAAHHLEQLKTQAANGACDPHTVISAVQPLSTLNADTWQACITAPAADIATNPVCNDPAVVTIAAYLQNAGDPGAVFLGTLTSKISYTLQEARTLAQQTDDPKVLARIESDVTTLEKAIKRAQRRARHAARHSHHAQHLAEICGLVLFSCRDNGRCRHPNLHEQNQPASTPTIKLQSEPTHTGRPMGSTPYLRNKRSLRPH